MYASRRRGFRGDLDQRRFEMADSAGTAPVHGLLVDDVVVIGCALNQPRRVFGTEVNEGGQGG